MTTTAEVLVIGAGPAGLALAAALCDRGVQVTCLTPTTPTARWTNTYGIWADELDALGLDGIFAHRWTDCTVHLGDALRPLGRTYALFDNDALRDKLLARGAHGGMTWVHGAAAAITHDAAHSHVTTRDGKLITARLVVDATGHQPVFVQRPPAPAPAYQAAYGIVGTFATPPVASGQMVLMDYRAEHLTPDERQAGPPTFLYAMDLGDGRYFVEETSLAHAPAVPMSVLQERLQRRLQIMGAEVTEVLEEERCLFPMNLPMPGFAQPVLGYGAAASMVHPATGYQVGAALARAGEVAASIAAAFDDSTATPAELARRGWSAVWPAARLRNHYLYLFGLQNVLRFNVDQTQGFFRAFFDLPPAQWHGYLSNTLATDDLMRTMLSLFGRAPTAVQLSLASSIVRDTGMLWRALRS